MGDKGETGETGETGAKGDTGETGAKGDQGNPGTNGAPGTSAVYYSASDNLTVPAGSYAISASATLGNFDDDPQSGSCTLSTGASQSLRLDNSATSTSGIDPGEEFRGSLTMLDAETFNATTTIHMECGGFMMAEGPGSSFIQAVKVGSVNP